MTADEELDYLSLEDLLEIASGVLDDVAVRDPGLLAAAAARPMTTVFGDDAYPASRTRSRRCCIPWPATTPWWTATNALPGRPRESSASSMAAM